MTGARIEGGADVLTGGQWVIDQHRRVMVWEEARPVLEAAPDVRDIKTLIACPYCRAKVTQSCRTSTGQPRDPHTMRIGPRLCECGERLGPKRQLCDECRDARNRENQRAWVARKRAS